MKVIESWKERVIAIRCLICFIALFLILGICLVTVWGLGTNIPVYMYHSINSTPFVSDTELFVNPDDFQKEIEFLSENGYEAIFASEIPKAWKLQKPVAVTFDDGYEDNYTIAFPVLKKYNIKATIFVVSGSIGKPNYLTEQQIKEMSDSGLISIQSHTNQHVDLARCTKEELSDELAKSKQMLEGITGKNVNVISYPGGKRSAEVLKEASKLYDFAYITFGNEIYSNKIKYQIPRVGIFRSTDFNEFVRITNERSGNRFENIIKKFKRI